MKNIKTEFINSYISPNQYWINNIKIPNFFKILGKRDFKLVCIIIRPGKDGPNFHVMDYYHDQVQNLIYINGYHLAIEEEEIEADKIFLPWYAKFLLKRKCNEIM